MRRRRGAMRRAAAVAFVKIKVAGGENERMPLSAFTLKTISGRPVLSLPRSGSFPTEAADFEFAKLTMDEADDVKMVWWLFMAYFHRYEMLPTGTRSEVVIAALLIANHLRHNGWGGPGINQSWPLHRRQCTEIAFARLCDIDKASPLNTAAHNPSSHEWSDADATARHSNLMSRLAPMMQKLSDNASFNARRVAFVHCEKLEPREDCEEEPPPQSARVLPRLGDKAQAQLGPKRSSSFKNLFFFRRSQTT
jgi:hypothetical protein